MGFFGNSEKVSPNLLGKYFCQPKDQGDLGFKKVSDVNRAYMTKLAWQLINNPKKLWVKIMKTKYNCDPHGMPIVSNKNNASNIWRTIVQN